MPQKYLKRSVRKRIRGAAMVEALLSFFVIFLVLFGMLQVFYFFAGQYFFRKSIEVPGNNEHNHDIAVFLSNEFEKFSFTVDFPSEDL